MEEAADSDAAVTQTTLYITCILLVLGRPPYAPSSPLSDDYSMGDTYPFKASQPCVPVGRRTSAYTRGSSTFLQNPASLGANGRKRTEFSLSPNVMWPREEITINRSHAKQCGPANFIPVDCLLLPLFLPRSSPRSFETLSRSLPSSLSCIRTRGAIIAGPRGP